MNENEFIFAQQIIAESKVESLYIEISKLRSEKKILMAQLAKLKKEFKKCQTSNPQF
jgi:chaperonin cofactor prefoldin